MATAEVAVVVALRIGVVVSGSGRRSGAVEFAVAVAGECWAAVPKPPKA